jgi:Dolichyl-phosphate-mannose-protein mannosyltransferase
LQQRPALNSNKKIGLLIFACSVLRLAVAGCLELGNDEVYYQAYAQHLQWNYFDHPPMVALLIRLSTMNLFLTHEFFIRLGSVICAAAGTWLIYKIGKFIRNEQTGLIAAILYSTSFYSSVIAGIFILPDSPLVIFWLLAVYSMICILESRDGIRKQNLYFILLGVSTGLCIMSKIHGIFLWLGFGAYLVFYRRDILKSPMLWFCVLISIIIISPIFFWNLANHFVTYAYHQSRIGFLGGSPNLNRLLQQVLGSVFYSNPVNFIIYTLSVYALLKHRFLKPPGIYPLLLWLSFPLIIVLLVTSVFNETLPHWSGPAYLSLMLVAASWLDERARFIRIRWLKTAGWFFAIVVTIGTLCIRFLPLQIGNREISYLGAGDITLDMNGWKKFASDFDLLYQADISAGIMKPGAVIISDYWFPAGHLDHYYSVPFHRNLIAFGDLNSIHHFAWLNKIRPRLINGTDAYFIYPTNEYGPPKPNLKNAFGSVEDPVLISQFRSGQLVRYFVIYRMHNFQGDSTDYLISGIK